VPNYYVDLEGGKTLLVWATHIEAAKATALKRYKRKTGRSGKVKRVR
jgi:hypothetical protein